MTQMKREPKTTLIEQLTNEKHKIFCFEYISNGQNATRAYMKAYPSVKRTTAMTNGSLLLVNTKIKSALREYFDDYYEAKKDLAGETLRVLEGILKSDISNVIKYQNGKMEILDLDEIQDTSVIQSIEHTTSDTKYGENVKKSVKMYDKLKAAETVAKITNMISDKADLTGTITIIPAKRPDEKEGE